MSQLPDPLRRLRADTAERERRGLRRTPRVRTPDGAGVLDLASNDYLGLARDPRVVEAAAAAARCWGAGSTGSRLVTGSTELHARLESRLAEAMYGGRALVFSSGYLANLAAITALAPAGTLIVSDQANHASLIDACRLARGRTLVTPHLDTGAVEAALAARTEPAALVVTEGVFSVSGRQAPLAELHRIARRHGALLVVDEAHALGVVGPQGRGAAVAAGIAGPGAPAPDLVRTATLSKSLGAQGGAVVAAPEVVETLVDTGRGFIFDTALAPAAAGAALAALGVVLAEPGLPLRARAHARKVAEIAAGLDLRAGAPDAAVVSVVLGSPHTATAAARLCLDRDVHVGCFRPPSVPDGGSCLRLTARADLSAADLDRVAHALSAVAGAVRAAGASPGTAR
ncbi:8-amino-7-oxononanoate synthase [Allonocardiopsis opalescens]|nr:8-amino-7-oxononanoate synthase [Allonocardiopsis opalescens]